MQPERIGSHGGCSAPPTIRERHRTVAKDLSSLVSQRFVTEADAKKVFEEAKRAEIP
jgi:hypothetical protein